MRNRAAKVPEGFWQEVKARVQAVYQAPSRAIARDLAKGIFEYFGRRRQIAAEYETANDTPS